MEEWRRGRRGEKGGVVVEADGKDRSECPRGVWCVRKRRALRMDGSLDF